MTLPRYPDYKDSGVPWLGEVPGHWDSRRTKYLFDLMARDVAEDDGIVTAFRDGEVTLRANRRTDGFTNALKEVGYQGVRKGDLVIHAMDAFAGAIGVADSDGKSTPVYSVCKPKNSTSNAHYYAHVLRHMALGGFINSLAKGVRERSTDFRWADAGSLYLPLPPIDEQDAIVCFLDRETAKIDALIAEQETLLALLAEKRQATISHAVTRGLNSNVAMKDSGIAWLGEVPGHWVIGGLTKFIGPVVDYRGRTPTKGDDGMFLVTAKNIRNGSIDYEASEEYVDPEEAAILLARGAPEIGDVLFTTEAPLGQVAQIDRTDIALAQRVVKFRGATDVLDNRFMMYWLMGDTCQARLEMLATGSTALGIKASKLGQIDCLVPPTIGEQEQIVRHIDAETAKLDALKTEAQRGIELLKERRNALIAAAVTGKIDVRNAA